MAKKKDTERIEGNFIITKDSKFYIGKRELEKSDEVHLSIKKLKEIIKDAKEGII